MTSKDKKLSGSTLTLSVLTMSIILSSIYILANISIRNSKQLFNAVSGSTAILGADGAAEQGLWTYIREQTSYQGNCDQSPAEYETTTLSNPLTHVTISSCRTLLRPSPSTISIPANTTKLAYIINPASPNGPSEYSEATFSWVAGSGTVKLCQWDVADCTVGPYLANFSQSGAGSPVTVTLNQPDDRYVIVYETASTNFLLSISGKDESGNPKGLPADLATIIGIGRDNFTTRQIEVQVLP